MVKKSISNAHFVVFRSRRCQNVEKNSFLKTYYSLIIAARGGSAMKTLNVIGEF